MWSSITHYYKEYIDKYADPRIKDYPLMDTPMHTIYIVGAYLLFIKIIGPMYMKNRPPMNIKNIIVGYNAFQCMYSFLLFLISTYYAYKANFNLKCQVQDYNKTDYYTIKLINLSYFFLFGRFVEFLDTIFFILRKKNNQVTTLHVVHHALVPIISWVGIKILPGGHYTIAGLINVFVHTFMYLYYMLAALGPEYKKYLWWKRYMTLLQLAQFLIVIAHTTMTLITGCPVPRIFGYLVLFQAVLFYKMFYDYYKEAFGSTINRETFSIEKYYEKYRKFFEMCIPNQHVLLDDSTDNTDGDREPIDVDKPHTD